MNKGEVHDTEIAPLLLKAAKIAKKNGISLIAVCEYEPGQFSITRTIEPGASPYLTLVDLAEKAHGNIDNLILEVMKGPHTSFCLATLARTIEPPKEPTT